MSRRARYAPGTPTEGADRETRPRPPHLHVNVTVTLHRRRFGWLVAGTTIGALQAADLVVQVASLLLRAAGHP